MDFVRRMDRQGILLRGLPAGRSLQTDNQPEKISGHETSLITTLGPFYHTPDLVIPSSALLAEKSSPSGWTVKCLSHIHCSLLLVIVPTNVSVSLLSLLDYEMQETVRWSVRAVKFQI